MSGAFSEQRDDARSGPGAVDAVIHFRTPPANGGYDHRNPVRIESARQAAAIDEAILHAWAGHPRRSIVESENDFLKPAHAIALVLETVPECRRPLRT
jgi:hypothetical protein